MGEDLLLTVVSVAGLMASVAAAAYAYLNFRLKSGIEVRGSFGICSSIASEDRYVYSVTLENLKDRAIVIFKIFFEVDHGYYIEIHDFEDEPLVLRPFEAFSQKYDPIEMYLDSGHRIRMDGLLENRWVRKRLVLATSQGRYNVVRRIGHWDALSDFFRNHLTVVAIPIRPTYEGKSYGSGTKYVVSLTTAGGKQEIIPIYPRDFEVMKFRRFQLTRESLQSREALETFLLERAVCGDLVCTDLSVMDLDEWRKEFQEREVGDVVEVKPRGWFSYKVGGWFVTRWEDLVLYVHNRSIRRKHREALRSRREQSSRS